MPLPKPVAREEIHNRTIEMRGFRREDGFYDVEGRITDIKTYDFQPAHGRNVAAGTPVHDMWVRLVIDDDMLIHEVYAVTDASPFPDCPDAAPGVEMLKGASLAKGWRAAISEKLGGVSGCTHIRELLNTIGSAAHQAMGPVRKAKEQALHGDAGDSRRTGIINSCHAYASDRNLVMLRWPDRYTGKNAVRKDG